MKDVIYGKRGFYLYEKVVGKDDSPPKEFERYTEYRENGLKSIDKIHFNVSDEQYRRIVKTFHTNGTLKSANHSLCGIMRSSFGGYRMFRSVLDRKDGPAVIKRDSSGKIDKEAWYEGGKAHRTDGPAILTYDFFGHARPFFRYQGEVLSFKNWIEIVKEHISEEKYLSLKEEYARLLK